MIRHLTNKDLLELNNFINNEEIHFNYFIKLGWNFIQLKNHLNKKSNFSLGYFQDNYLKGILIGDKLPILTNFELEIHIIYVGFKNRQKKIGFNLINFVEINKNSTNINKIYLEVSDQNIEAVKFYEKNNFVFTKIRHNYYNHDKNYSNAKCFTKKK